MFERFTERARQVVVLAQDEARFLKHNYIGTEHLLLGLLREEEGLGYRALDNLGVKVSDVRAFVAKVVGQGDEVTTGQIPVTPRAKKVLELALREALSLGHNYIGTEHILLGLVRENEGVGVRYLKEHDVDAEMVRNEIIRMLVGPGRRKDPPIETKINITLSERMEWLGEAIRKVRDEKEAAIENQEYVRAAELREQERELMQKAKTNGKLNEATVIVLERAMVEQNRELCRCQDKIAQLENELEHRRAEQERVAAGLAGLAETLGEEFSNEMYQRVISR